jgi:N-dimethylarginine dimethylaminohydrolase
MTKTVSNSAATFGGQSMVRPLRRVLLCDPMTAGWDRAESWRELGFLHAPDSMRAQGQHARLQEKLLQAGAEVVLLAQVDELTLDAVYVHDASFMTDLGVILLRMGKAGRRDEPGVHRATYEKLGIPILGEIVAPGMAEAGDMVWLDEGTLLIGRGYRTNSAGIEQMRSLLGSRGIDVLAAPLPHGCGPSSCLHLMSLMSVLDEHTVLVDSPWLAVETHEELKRSGFRSVEIDVSERESLACNVLALGGNSLLAFEENRKTNARLGEAGFEVLTFQGSEIGINGGGGPTCLTRPVLRG